MVRVPTPRHEFAGVTDTPSKLNLHGESVGDTRTMGINVLVHVLKANAYDNVHGRWRTEGNRHICSRTASTMKISSFKRFLVYYMREYTHRLCRGSQGHSFLFPIMTKHSPAR